MAEPSGGQSAYIASLYETLSLLVAQRKQVLEAGPAPDYTVGKYSFNWTQYLEYLSKEIDKVTGQIRTAEIGCVVNTVSG